MIKNFIAITIGDIKGHIRRYELSRWDEDNLTENINNE